MKHTLMSACVSVSVEAFNGTLMLNGESRARGINNEMVI